MSVHYHPQHSTAAPPLPSVSAWATAATVASATTTASGSSTPASFSSPEQWPGYTPIWDYDLHPVAPCVPDSRRPPRHSHPDHILHSEPIDPASVQYRRRSTRISSSSSSNSSTSSLQLHSSPLPKKPRTVAAAAAISAKSGRRPLLLRLLRKPVSSSSTSPSTLLSPISSLPSPPASSPESHDRDPNTTTQPQPQPQPQSKPQHQHPHQHSHHRYHHSLDSSMSLQDRSSSGQRLRASRFKNSASSLASLTEERQLSHTSTTNEITGDQSRPENGRRIPSSSLPLHPATPGGPSSSSNSPRPLLSQRRRGVAVAAVFNDTPNPADSKAALSSEQQQQQQQQQRSPLEEQQLRWHQDWLRPSGAMLSRFRDRPALFNCPRCGAIKVVSETQFVPGAMSYLVAFGLLFLTLGTLSYIPFRKGHEGTKDCVHWCPKCNQRVARFSRANATWEWL
ncbi:hypothetical protein EMPS_08361 [Entomortierella parvispora]|uniref:LITAF domain-containing protein n=1 Tax=Entomortierella parvispora TaxID=205924 RepID=A0A9P3HG77_9FUNG|nr:hypothetical protein EMPS_08361 [Entomortierella parvispora]